MSERLLQAHSCQVLPLTSMVWVTQSVQLEEGTLGFCKLEHQRVSVQIHEQSHSLPETELLGEH